MCIELDRVLDVNRQVVYENKREINNLMKVIVVISSIYCHHLHIIVRQHTFVCPVLIFFHQLPVPFFLFLFTPGPWIFVFTLVTPHTIHAYTNDIYIYIYTNDIHICVYTYVCVRVLK